MTVQKVRETAQAILIGIAPEGLARGKTFEQIAQTAMSLTLALEEELDEYERRSKAAAKHYRGR